MIGCVKQELRRFPTLQAEIAAAASQALEKFREESKRTVIRLVDMESSYLTADFFRRLPQEVDMGGNQGPSTVDRYTEGHFQRIASNVSLYIGMVSETLKHTIPKAVVYCQVREAKRSLLNHFYAQIGKKEVLSLSLSLSFMLILFASNLLITILSSVKFLLGLHAIPLWRLHRDVLLCFIYIIWHRPVDFRIVTSGMCCDDVFLEQKDA